MGAQHTPGPWRLGKADRGYIVLGGPSENYVANVVVQQLGGGAIASAMEPRREANARLIAAAPDLLAVVKRWAAIDGGLWHFERYAQEKAELEADTRAAIAKATGEAA